MDKIDSRLFGTFNESPDLKRFFAQSSGKGDIEDIKISRIKNKISRICENLISVSQEAFSVLEEGNTIRVLKKKSEFKPEFLRGIWKNYKKFLTKSVKSVQKIFDNEKDFNIMCFTEKYLETCLLNLKCFFVHLYEMATKFYAKKRTDQVSWISQKKECVSGLRIGWPQKRKFSFEEASKKRSCWRKECQGTSKQRGCKASVELSKSSFTSESMSPEMVKNKMEIVLSELLSKHTPQLKLNSSKESPNWMRSINSKDTPSKEGPRKRRKSSIIQDVFDGLEAIHYSQGNTNRFFLAKCEGIGHEDDEEELLKHHSSKRNSYSGIFEEGDEEDNNFQSMQNFLIETNENFIATRKPSWLDKDKSENPIMNNVKLESNWLTRVDERQELVPEKSEEYCDYGKNEVLEVKSKKKIIRKKWTPEEDKILFDFLKETYPKKIISSQILNLAEQLNRTKSSISNRLKMLKKNKKKELEKITEEMIGTVLPKTRHSLRQTNSSRNKSKGTHIKEESQNPFSSNNIDSCNTFKTEMRSQHMFSNPKSEQSISRERYIKILETFKAIQPLISEKEQSFIEIQNYLKVETEWQFNTLVDHIEELKTICKIRSREAVFIQMREVVVKTLQQKKENFWPEGGYSAILDFIFTSFYHQDFAQLSLKEIKEKVIGQFNFDMNIESFDEQFLQYLQNSQYFLISRKEVYFI
jgi:hypothetical protein